MLLTMPSARLPCSAILSRAAQHLDDLVDRGTLVVAERGHGRCRRLFEFQQQFARQLGEVVDEVQWVLISCAMPAASWPGAAIFWACSRLACAACSSCSAFSAVSRAARISASARLRSVTSL
jgi:hypothetical protein